MCWFKRVVKFYVLVIVMKLVVVVVVLIGENMIFGVIFFVENFEFSCECWRCIDYFGCD